MVLASFELGVMHYGLVRVQVRVRPIRCKTIYSTLNELNAADVRNNLKTRWKVLERLNICIPSF